ncbi:DUF6007 family protein [Mammaliicoccus sp. Dog046]|uniref:DUF6007 family protein n=1 Tax=Mammaliicoccus sp. Dog046 TaxID=3034233 RepID=UPI002B2598BE|nr:DUF6007 family protein [Mammaliicoccus sp. Dog046]WQK85217.1 DUF6007 family protein [Mammaliicoccus sp. Dog046]
MDNLKESLNNLGWLDLIFLIPLFFLYSYLPTYNVLSFILNVVIVILVSIGLATLSLTIKSILKNKHPKS